MIDVTGGGDHVHRRARLASSAASCVRVDRAEVEQAPPAFDAADHRPGARPATPPRSARASSTATLGSSTPGAPPPPTAAADASAVASTSPVLQATLRPRAARASADRRASAARTGGCGPRGSPPARPASACRPAWPARRVRAAAVHQFRVAEQQAGLRAAEQLVAAGGDERGARAQRGRRVRFVRARAGAGAAARSRCRRPGARRGRPARTDALAVKPVTRKFDGCTLSTNPVSRADRRRVVGRRSSGSWCRPRAAAPPRHASRSGMRKPSPISTSSPRLSTISLPWASTSAGSSSAAALLLTTCTAPASGTAAASAASAARPRRGAACRWRGRTRRRWCPPRPAGPRRRPRTAAHGRGSCARRRRSRSAPGARRPVGRSAATTAATTVPRRQLTPPRAASWAACDRAFHGGAAERRDPGGDQRIGEQPVGGRHRAAGIGHDARQAWRRRTGIEPASGSSCRSTVLKTAPATRPDTPPRDMRPILPPRARRTRGARWRRDEHRDPADPVRARRRVRVQDPARRAGGGRGRPRPAGTGRAASCSSGSTTATTRPWSRIARRSRRRRHHRLLHPRRRRPLRLGPHRRRERAVRRLRHGRHARSSRSTCSRWPRDVLPFELAGEVLRGGLDVAPAGGLPRRRRPQRSTTRSRSTAWRSPASPTRTGCCATTPAGPGCRCR